MKLILSFTKYNNIEEMSNLHKQAYELMYKPSTIMTNKSTWTFGSPSILYMYYREKGKLQEQLSIMKNAMPYYYKITQNHGIGAESVSYTHLEIVENDEEEGFESIDKDKSKQYI